MIEIKIEFHNTPFQRQNYRSERDAEKRLGTNTTGKICFLLQLL